MTTQTHPTLAARLRELHAARTRHFTSPGGTQAWSIVATDERLGDLLAAADELEKAAIEASFARLNADAIRFSHTNQLIAVRRVVEEVERSKSRQYLADVAQSVLAKWQEIGRTSMDVEFSARAFNSVKLAIESLCDSFSVAPGERVEATIPHSSHCVDPQTVTITQETVRDAVLAELTNYLDPGTDEPGDDHLVAQQVLENLCRRLGVEL